MALDTRERRASAVSLNPGAPPSPTPLAIPDQEWRQESGWGYAAILVGAPVVPAPPPPIPVVVEVAGGVIVLPGIDRRIFSRWHRDVLEFWIRYFVETVGLSEVLARVQALEIMEATDQMEDVSPRDFWRDYFRRVDLESRKAYLIEMDDEEILSLL